MKRNHLAYAARESGLDGGALAELIVELVGCERKTVQAQHLERLEFEGGQDPL